MRRITFLLVLIIFTLGVYCQNSRFSGFSQSKNGIKFMILKNGTDVPLSFGNYVKLDYIIYSGDTIIFNSYQAKPRVLKLDSSDSGEFSVNSLVRIMNIGDSTLFMVSADSIYKGKEMPSFIKKGSNIYYTIKLYSQQNKQEFESEYKVQIDLMNTLAASEKTELEKYIKSNKIKVLPDKNGIYYIEKKKGHGNCPVNGDTVCIQLGCYLINGKEVYKSCSECKPIEFVLGSGKLLKGVEEGLLKMHKNGKCRLILPSSQAYGAAGYQTVPSYSTLIVDIELIEIK